MQTNTASSTPHHMDRASKGRGNWLRKSAAVVLLSPALLWVAPASGSVIYSNGANPPTNFPTSDLAPNPDQGLPQRLADDFTLTPGRDTITDVHWTGRYFPNPLVTATDSFTIDICTDASGSPGTCFSLTFASAVSRTLNASNNYFDYFVYVNPTQVVGLHWISIYNNTTADPDNMWLWGAQLGGNAVQTNSTTVPASGPWASTQSKMDFEFTGVPEPASLALVSLGLAGLLIGRRKVSG